jgi:AcrR family transcriptional regulator
MATQDQRRKATIGAIVEAARTHFGRDGYDATSIDDIASRAGVAKGAVYHHFSSKAQVFAAVIDQVHGASAAVTIRAAKAAATPKDAIVAGTRAFLLASMEPECRRIVLTDGPAVLGWQKWRELDEKHFGKLLRVSLKGALGERADDVRLSATCHMLLGAITEAALIASTAPKPRPAVDGYMIVFERLLHGALLD